MLHAGIQSVHSPIQLLLPDDVICSVEVGNQARQLQAFVFCKANQTLFDFGEAHESSIRKPDVQFKVPLKPRSFVTLVIPENSADFGLSEGGLGGGAFAF